MREKIGKWPLFVIATMCALGWHFLSKQKILWSNEKEAFIDLFQQFLIWGCQLAFVCCILCYFYLLWKESHE